MSWDGSTNFEAYMVNQEDDYGDEKFRTLRPEPGEQIVIDETGIHLPESMRVKQVAHYICDRCSTVILEGMWPYCRPGKDPVEEHGKPNYTFHVEKWV